MPVDRTIVGNVASDVMGQLEERFGDDEVANARAVFLSPRSITPWTNNLIPRSAGASAKAFLDTKPSDCWSTSNPTCASRPAAHRKHSGRLGSRVG